MPSKDAAATASELKHIFNAARIRHIADETQAVYPSFDSARFVARCVEGLDDLSLMQRLRRVSEALHATLPADYRAALRILRALAPRLNSGFVSMALPEYVAAYGADDVDASLDALQFFTRVGSSEFAIRHFLRRDLHGTLAVMTRWSTDENEHVRRLASEGTRSHLPWAKGVPGLVTQARSTRAIVDALYRDESETVRRSVANHVNDLSRDHPDVAADIAAGWSAAPDDHTPQVARHAMRTLVKKGHPAALAVLGFSGADFAVDGPVVTDDVVPLGSSVHFTARVTNEGTHPARAAIDFVLHFQKSRGSTRPKVFKIGTRQIAPGETVDIAKAYSFRSQTTRVFHPGEHAVELQVNGVPFGRATFQLVADEPA